MKVTDREMERRIARLQEAAARSESGYLQIVRNGHRERILWTDALQEALFGSCFDVVSEGGLADLVRITME